MCVLCVTILASTIYLFYREIQDLPGELYPSDNHANVIRRQNASIQSDRSSIAMESFDRLDVETDGINI